MVLTIYFFRIFTHVPASLSFFLTHRNVPKKGLLTANVHKGSLISFHKNYN